MTDATINNFDFADCMDVVVLGAGPAGSNAALEAARHGLSVLLIDDGLSAGGQVWRAPSTLSSIHLSDGDPDRLAGDVLRASLAASTVRTLENAVVWSVVAQADGSARFRVELYREEQMITVYAAQLVSAFGAVERVVPFPGWTLPGVFGLAAATSMLKRDGRLPGRHIAVAGQGPLLIAVAAKALASGLPPQFVIDIARRRDWIRSAIGFARSPAQLLRGAGWLVALTRAGVPYHSASAVIEAHGTDRLEAVDIAMLHPDGSPLASHSSQVEVDTLFVGNGLSPVAEVPRLLGAKVRHDALRGGFSVIRDGYGRTDVPGLLVAGDGSGVHGAIPSSIAGSLAGVACALDSGKLSAQLANRRGTRLHQRHRRAEPCATASCRLMQVSSRRIASIPAHTIVCRCEQVSREAIDNAARTGVRHLDELKTSTRLGMGPCQGRVCGPALRFINGWGPDRVRPPLLPISTAALAEISAAHTREVTQ